MSHVPWGVRDSSPVGLVSRNCLGGFRGIRIQPDDRLNGWVRIPYDGLREAVEGWFQPLQACLSRCPTTSADRLNGRHRRPLPNRRGPEKKVSRAFQEVFSWMTRLVFHDRLSRRLQPARTSRNERWARDVGTLRGLSLAGRAVTQASSLANRSMSPTRQLAHFPRPSGGASPRIIRIMVWGLILVAVGLTPWPWHNNLNDHG